ncbi:MAG: Vps62-related protein [Chloroflexi bacterium]|nr:Vps62-related protein [Chloroflexota bacterium]
MDQRSAPIQPDTLDWAGADGYQDAVTAMRSIQPAFDIRETIDRFAPELRFHPKESHFPSSVDWYMERIQLRFDRRFRRDVPVGVIGSTSLEMLAHQKCHGASSSGIGQEPLFMEIPRDGSERTVEAGEVESARIYVHVRSSIDAPDMFDIQYWFFYPRNGWDDRHHKHDGDWEHITVRVANTEAAESSAIYYAAHSPGHGRWVPFDEVPISTAELPIVYSARGSHASYTNAAAFKRGGLRPIDHTGEGGRVWNTLGHTEFVAINCQPLVNHDWLTYLGRWGESGKWYLPWPTYGPIGPAFQKSWYTE